MVMGSANANTFVTDDPAALPSAIGVREDLSDVITRISPTETPVFSNGKKGTCANTIFDWLVEELAAASTSNKQPEGFEATIDASNTPARFNNVTQILAKSWSVSGTLEAVNKAGRAREARRQQLLKGMEIRRDLELILTTPAAKDTSDPRGMATLGAWITNISKVGASTTPTGDGSDITDGAGVNAAFSIAKIDTVMQACYEDGGNPTMMTVSPANKQNFSDLGSTGTGLVPQNRINQTAVEPAKLIGTVDVYLSDFGRLEVIPDRFHPNDVIYLLDPEHYMIVNLPGRNFTNERLSKTGDSEKGFVVGEFSLKMTAPKAHGMIIDIDHTADHSA